MIRIVTQLDEGAALAALRELAPKEHDARFFSLESTFEGQIDPQRLVIGYRLNAVVPPIRIATFRGRVRQTDAGTRIHGEISSGWITYVLAAWLVAVTLLAIGGYVVGGNYFSDIWVLAIPVGLFFFGRAFIRTTQDYVVTEIGRAVRGKLTQD